jgi:hypothetical protein
MNMLLAALAAGFFTVASTAVLAADPPKADGKAADAKAAAPAKLEKPANVTAEAWAKMSDADKQKAVDAAKTAGKDAPAKTATEATAKPKKGGC